MRRHPHRALVLSVASSLAFSLAAPPAPAQRRTGGEHASPSTADPTTSLLRELGAAARCRSQRSPHRVWCIPADGYAGGTAAPIPAGEHSLLGLTIELESGRPVARALTERVSLASLALRSDGARVAGRIQSITPSNPGEARELGEAVAAIALVFKGLSPRATVSPGLVSYLGSLPARASYPVTAGARGWTIEGASTAELRRVGDHWVAIETPRSGRGIFVSVFTDRFGAGG